MSTLTIILLVYIILDIIATTIVVIKLKSMGITIRSLARLLHLHKHQAIPTYKGDYDEDDFDEYEDLS